MVEIFLVVTTMKKKVPVGYRRKVSLPAVPQKGQFVFGKGFGGDVKDIMYRVTEGDVMVTIADESIDYETFRLEEWEACDPEVPFHKPRRR
jgi:hypothetical protein